MANVREWLRRLWRGGRRTDHDLDSELQLHLELLTEEKLRQGHSPAEAGRLARVEAGGLAQAMESMRDQRSLPWLEDFIADSRLAARQMRRTPLFTIVAVVSLALGIGANTAIFSLVNTLMLRQLPVRQPEQLVELLSRFPGEPRLNGFSWSVYEHFRDNNRVFADLIAMSAFRLPVGGQAFESAPVHGEYVVGKFFETLGVQPAMGRVIVPADDQAGAEPVAVISWAFWRSRFNGDPAAVGQRITIGATSAVIVGITPREFTGVNIAARPQVWLPAAVEPAFQQPSQRLTGALPVALMARLKPGVSVEQARAEMLVLDRWRVEQALKRAPNLGALTIDVEPAATGLAMLRDGFARPLLVLMAVVGLLLFAACSNIAGMLMARGAARQREVAVRVSLGAPRLRLLRQLLTESVLLALAGGVAGVALAYASVNVLVGILTSGRGFVGLIGPIQLDAQLDGRVLVFTAGVSLLAGLLFGLVPAWQAVAAPPAPVMRESGTSGPSRSRMRFGTSLVMAQVAVSLVLLTVSGLFIGHLSSLRNTGLGFDRSAVLLVTLDPANSGYERAQLFQPYQDLLATLARVPGVSSATLSAVTPIHGAGAASFVTVDGFPEAPEAREYASVNWVAPRYFETFATPLVAGRDFRFDDQGRAPVAIVNQAIERHYFPGRSAIGQRLSLESLTGRPTGEVRSFEIVGVVGDAKYIDLRREAPPTVYLNPFQEPRMSSHRLSLRTSVDPIAVAGDVQRVVSDALKTGAVAGVTTLSDQVNASIVPERLAATLSGLFGALGAILVGIGLYGLLAFAVNRRINEIGVRMALGATRGDITRMVLKSAAGCVAVGLIVGTPLAMWGQRLAGNWVENLGPVGALPIVAAAAIVVAVAAGSTLVPVQRAAGVSPAEALRRD
ncbi:MAG: ADOP family duplicated permease [Vicinamibacterales bacterium]